MRREWPVVLWAVVCLGWLVVVWTWDSIHLTLTVDDTYYYFKTALNVAHGNGSTFDGINPTDGYHPLWLAILAGLFTPLGDDMVLLTRIVFTLQIVMVWGGGMLLARLPETGRTKVLLPLALALINPLTAKIVLCGQETAVQFLLSAAALVLWWSSRTAAKPVRPGQWAALAAVCVLATLARLDTVFFCGALLAMPLVLPSERERSLGIAGRVKLTALGMGVFGGGLGAFLIYHYASFGHLMPVSGAIKMHLDEQEVAPTSARLAVALIGLGGIGWIWFAARRHSSPLLALLAPPIAGALVVAIYNFGVRGEMSPQLVRIWYLEPYLLTGALVIGGLLVRRRVVWVAACAAAGWLALSAFTWWYRLQPRSYSLYAAAERCSRWVDEHDVGAVGAAWDAGFAGAFTKKSVMNLDGLINSWEYKSYLDRGRVDEFITERQPVDFVIQYAYTSTLRAIAKRFENAPLPVAPQPQTSVTGARDITALSSRWGVDLATFYVAHVECVSTSVATDPTDVHLIYYLVLTRKPVTGRTTLAEFARANHGNAACNGSDTSFTTSPDGQGRG